MTKKYDVCGKKYIMNCSDCRFRLGLDCRLRRIEQISYTYCCQQFQKKYYEYERFGIIMVRHYLHNLDISMSEKPISNITYWRVMGGPKNIAKVRKRPIRVTRKEANRFCEKLGVRIPKLYEQMAFRMILCTNSNWEHCLSDADKIKDEDYFKFPFLVRRSQNVIYTKSISDIIEDDYFSYFHYPEKVESSLVAPFRIVYDPDLSFEKE